MPVLAATQQLRSDLQVLTGDASRRVAHLLRGVSDASKAKEILVNELPMFIEGYGAAAATVTADWYDALRAAERIGGRLRALAAPVAGGSEALAGWALSPVFKAKPDWSAALALLEGGLQRRILQPSRDTIMDSTAADPQATGWQRVARVDACYFCVMLADRGAVYSEKTVNFGAHDNCHCVAAPAWGGRPLPVKPFKGSRRNISDADRARVRQWIADNKGYLEVIQ